MKVERYNEAKKIMNEIEQADKFLNLIRNFDGSHVLRLYSIKDDFCYSDCEFISSDFKNVVWRAVSDYREKKIKEFDEL